MDDELIQQNQQEAVKKNDTGPAVLEGDERESRSAYFADVAKANPTLEKFGFKDDLEAFIRKAGSDAIFARRVIRFVLGLDDAPAAIGTVGSPQENNITGTLDHSTYPPTLVDSLGTKEDAVQKSSGDEKDAGDWTKAGDGTEYPKES